MTYSRLLGKSIENLKTFAVMTSRSDLGKQVYDALMNSKALDINIDNQKVRVLGIGAKRMVFEINGYAVKVARDSDGRQANLKEREIYDYVQGTDYEKYFVPILESDEDVVIMPKVTAIASDMNVTNERIEEIRQALFDNLPKGELIAIDLHDGNLTPDGKVLDYGEFIAAF